MPRHHRVFPPLTKVHECPVEICSEIFLFLIQTDPRSQRNLMLVCCRWYDIMLSTPGNRRQLRIGKSTQEEEVKAVIRGNRSLLDVIVDMNIETYGRRPISNKFHASLRAAAQAASRWRSFELVSPPPSGEYEYLQTLQPLQRLESFKLSLGCDVGNFLEPFMAAITSTATPRLTGIEVADLKAVLYLGRPAFLHIFHSVRSLSIQLPKRMDSPVDILPHLERLEVLEAHRLCFPTYPLDTHLPLAQTLHSLHLKCVSVQWLAGRDFPRLQQCSIIFPHHAYVIQSVNMPSCTSLKYDSNNLGTIRHFQLPPLAKLEVICGQWNSRRGNLQFMALHPIFSTAQSLTDLHLQVQCSENVLVYMLELAPALEKLWLGLSFPHALSKAFFQGFVSRRPNAIEMIGLSTQPIRPLCGQLKRLHLHYKRWLRGHEKTGIIQVFGDIMASAQDFSLHLSCDDGRKGQIWKVHEPVARPKELNHICVGFSSLHGIVPLTAALDHFEFTSPPFRESEYFQVSSCFSENFPIDFLFPFHNLKELRIYPLSLTMQSSTQLPSNFPLFRTLKVLYVGSIQPTLLAGQTLHSLARYRERVAYNRVNLDQGLLTEMPVCTRVVAGLCSFATFKLPQICELGIYFDHLQPKMVWEKHVAVNTNLSGLRLMHVFGWVHTRKRYLIKILRSLPALETLVITWDFDTPPSVDFFRGFVPMASQETSGLNKKSGEGHLPAILCPKLESLQIEYIDLPKEPQLMPVLNEIIGLRAVVGSPLKSLTFMASGRKWELIGLDGGFNMKEVVPAEAFRLDV